MSSIVMSPLSLLTLVICVLSFFVSLARVLMILYIALFFEEIAFGFVDFLIDFLL